MPIDDSQSSSSSTGAADGATARKSRTAPKAAAKPKASSTKAAAPKAAAPKAASTPAPAAKPKAAATAAVKKGKLPSRPGDLHRAAERLKQVSDPTRLRVLLALADEPRNVTQLREELGGISQPALSHHLALLRHGRLIEPSRQGKTNVYDLTKAGRELSDVVNKLMP